MAKMRAISHARVASQWCPFHLIGLRYDFVNVEISECTRSPAGAPCWSSIFACVVGIVKIFPRAIAHVWNHAMRRSSECVIEIRVRFCSEKLV